MQKLHFANSEKKSFPCTCKNSINPPLNKRVIIKLDTNDIKQIAIRKFNNMVHLLL